MTHPPVVLGIDFGGTKIATAVCDLAGNKLASRRRRQPGRARRPRQLRPRRPGRAGSARAQAADAPLAAVGVSTFGIPFDDRVELAPAIDGWEALAIGRELRRGVPRRAGHGWRPTPRRPRRPRPAGARWPAVDPGRLPEPRHRAGGGDRGRRPGAGGQQRRGRRDRLQPARASRRRPRRRLRMPLEEMVSGQALHAGPASRPARAERPPRSFAAG